MKIEPFKVEEWMNAYETQAVYNIAETCVESISLDELLELCGEERGAFLDALAGRRLTYGDIVGLSLIHISSALPRARPPRPCARRQSGLCWGGFSDGAALDRAGTAIPFSPQPLREIKNSRRLFFRPCARLPRKQRGRGHQDKLFFIAKQ